MNIREQEVRIAKMRADGMTRGAIADEMGLTLSAVKRRLRNIKVRTMLGEDVTCRS